MSEYDVDDIMCNPAQIDICIEFLGSTVPFFSVEGLSILRIVFVYISENQTQFHFRKNVSSEELFRLKWNKGNILIVGSGGNHLNPHRLIVKMFVDQFEIEKKRNQIMDWVKSESMWLNGNILIRQSKDLKSLHVNFNGDRYDEPESGVENRVTPNNGYLKIYEGTMTECYSAEGDPFYLEGYQGW